MRQEHLQGTGTVSNKKTGAAMGTFSYEARVEPAGGVMWRTDLSVGLDFRTATQVQAANERLILTIEDGRQIEFYVIGTQYPDSVRVSAGGAFTQ